MIIHSGAASMFLVLAGGLCALGGYIIGVWRQRSLLRLELEAEDADSHERVLEMIESLADGEPRARKDKRLN